MGKKVSTLFLLSFLFINRKMYNDLLLFSLDSITTAIFHSMWGYYITNIFFRRNCFQTYSILAPKNDEIFWKTKCDSFMKLSYARLYFGNHVITNFSTKKKRWKKTREELRQRNWIARQKLRKLSLARYNYRAIKCTQKGRPRPIECLDERWAAATR